MRVPTLAEWHSEPLCLDGEHALKTFFDKDHAEAYELFCENAMHYEEDLVFMPLRCFRYYVHSYMDYLLSNESEEDSDGASAFFVLVKLRALDLTADAEDVALAQAIAKTLKHLAENQRWYDANVDIYGSFPERAKECLSLIGIHLA